MTIIKLLFIYKKQELPDTFEAILLHYLYIQNNSLFYIYFMLDTYQL